MYILIFLMFSYRIIYYIKYIIYNLKQRYLFDFQRDKIFNCGKKIFLIVLSVCNVCIVSILHTIHTIHTAKSVGIYALI